MQMKTVIAGVQFLFIGVVLFVLTGCLPPGADDPLDFSTPSLSLRGAPFDVDEATLTVSGTGMSTIEEPLDPDESSITLEIPAGSSRTFEISINNETSAFSGIETANLESDTSVDISIDVEMNDLKLIVIDRNNERLIQMNDMSGSGWTEKNALDYSLFTDLLITNDVDYDQYGRIYTTVTDTGSNIFSIVRINSIGEIDKDFRISAPNLSTPSIYALAIDRNNSLIYYSYGNGTGETVVKADYSGNIITTYNSGLFFGAGIQGLTVDPDGYVHIVYDPNGDGQALEKLDPSGSGQIVAYNEMMYGAFDVQYMDGYLYFVGYDVDGQFNTIPLVYRLPVNYNAATSPATLDGNPNDVEDTFWGALRFLASIDGSLYIIDDDAFEARIIKIDDITGAGWESFQATDIGKSPFNFIGGQT
jgi:hypothetical protein